MKGAVVRTVSGAIAGSAPAPVALRSWEARDEWNEAIEIERSPDALFPYYEWFKAPDAAAAAEQIAELLVDRGELEGPTLLQVRAVGDLDWIRVEVDVELSVTAEIRARGVQFVREKRSRPQAAAKSSPRR